MIIIIIVIIILHDVRQLFGHFSSIAAVKHNNGIAEFGTPQN